MFTFTLLYSAITDDAEDLYSNKSGWNHGINEILAKLHAKIEYNRRRLPVRLASKIKQPMEDLVADNWATV